MNVDDWADVVAVTIKAALAPIVERVAILETRGAALASIPDRVVAIETKAAVPVSVPTVDLGDVHAHLATLVARVPETVPDYAMAGRVDTLERVLTAAVAELSERMAVVETKSDRPEPHTTSPVDVTPILERQAAVEALVAVLGDVPARLVTLETKAAMPVTVPQIDLGSINEQLATLVARQPDGVPDAIVGRLDGLERECAAIWASFRERLAVVETKVPDMTGLDELREKVTQLFALDPVGMTKFFEQLIILDERRLAVEKRVIALETRAAEPNAELAEFRARLDATRPDPVDLAPVTERVAAVEARIADIGDLRDKVVTLETKAGIPNAELGDLLARQDRLEAGMPAPVDLTPITSQLAAVSSKVEDIADVRDKVVALETKDAAAQVKELDRRLATVSDRTTRLEAAIEQPDPLVELVAKTESTVTTIAADLAMARERIAGIEARPTIPGPAGKDGADGAPGQDGMGFDDVVVEHDNERTFVLRAAKGDRVKTLGTFTIPAVIYRGVYEEGRAYTKGDAVTWGGSLWVVNEETSTKPGDGNKAFQLAVKRGADGKNGRDLAPASMPVVKRT